MKKQIFLFITKFNYLKKIEIDAICLNESQNSSM